MAPMPGLNGDLTPHGRKHVAELVEAAIGWNGLSGPKISATGRVSRATIDRVKRGEEVSDAMLRALGDVLELPRDFLLYVGRHDVDSIVRAGAGDPDLLRWTIAMIASNEGDLSTRKLSAHSRRVLRSLGH